ncbi:MAG: hypothetical protein PHE58_06785, partial [Candidatus Omnitrophica bacterium]|nr:hypothetical protein [Candidatus Omnitrophota bacterium]
VFLWPYEAGALDLKTTQVALGPDSVARGSAFGLAKTHEIYVYFHQGNYADPIVKETMSFLLADRIVMAHPEWLYSTRVLGRIYPYDRRMDPGENFMDMLFDWGDRQVSNYRWYGMINYGDTLSWYRNSDEDNSYDSADWHPIGRWGWFNCEAVGAHTGPLMQFLRTGNIKYFRFGGALARHIMDIDTCHYNTVANDRRLKNVIPDDYSRPGSMHRHNGNHWGDRNEEASHTNNLGIALYYYITGDERARDVLDETGEFFLSGRITYFRHPDIAPQRSIANVLWGDVVMYELTGDEKYKSAADKWAGLLYMGQKQNGAWGEDYNPVKKRWEKEPHMMYIESYALPALIAYHQMTGNKAIAETIVKATDFVIKNEEYSPYFDAAAYSYWLTGDQKYVKNIRERLDFTINHQNRSEDPIMKGMIYQKAYYARMEEFLYKVPFALELAVEGDTIPRPQ